MSFLVSVLQFNLYVFWIFWTFVVKCVFPIKDSIYNIFPQYATTSITKLILVDTVYKKKILIPKETKWKTIMNHPSYHERSFMFIEYELKDAGKVSGTYSVILRGGDRESLSRTAEYLDKTSLFEQYLSISPSSDSFVDCQFTVLNLDIEIDKTDFFNKLLGVDRTGHKFLQLRHDLVTINDLWKIVCILDGHLEWIDENVKLFTLDDSLRNKNYTPEVNFF
jgi:hypothetical protein